MKKLLFTVKFIALVTVCQFASSCKKAEFDTKPLEYSQAKNDFLYFENDTISSNLIEVIADSLRKNIKINPDIKEDALNDIASNLMKTSQAIQSNKASRIGYSDLEELINGKLNSMEQAIYKSNKAKSILCIANAQFAINYSKNKYQSNTLLNGNGDAFRHTLWNYGMTIDVGSVFARSWSDAHEYGANGQPAIERTMDLYNNSIGIQLGKDNPYTILHSTFVSKTQEKVRAGKLLIIINQKLSPSNYYGEK